MWAYKFVEDYLGGEDKCYAYSGTKYKFKPATQQVLYNLTSKSLYPMVTYIGGDECGDNVYRRFSVALQCNKLVNELEFVSYNLSDECHPKLTY